MLPISTILEKINPLDKQNSLLSTEFYLALVITDKKIKSGIWVLGEDGVKSLSFGSTENWSGENVEELIVASDSSITSAVANLPLVEGKQPTKVIFGLPEHWVKENSVGKGKYGILQTVCKKLLLKPMGFVVTPEAIAYFLKKEEGGFPGAILVSLGETEIIVSLILQGKFLGSKVVGRSENLALDLEEGLLRFDYHGELPSRIFLINDGERENLEDNKQNLVAYPWISPEGGKKLNFLQLPEVEVAGEGLEISSIVLAGGRELGQEPKEIPNDKEQELEEEKEAETEPVPLEKQEAEEGEELPGTDFGFVPNKDILLESPKQKIDEEQRVAETVEEEIAEIKEEILPLPKKRVRLPKVSLKKVVLKPISLFKKISLIRKKKIPRESFLSSSREDFSGVSRSPFRFVFLLAVFIFLILVGGVFGFWQFAKAEVKIFIRPLKINKEIELTVSPKIDSIDEAKMMIPVRQLTIEVGGDKTAAVTGKKTVGERATGEVVVYNGTDKAKDFPKGTYLKGPENLRFVLAAETVVPGKTTDLGATPPIDKWGEKKASVAAVEIGAQYNLVANSILNFEGIATSSAWLVKNPSAFSGGTSREISAVSKQDRENLQKLLIKELEEKASLEAKNQLTSQDRLLPDPIQLKSKTDRFNHEVDDEAESLSLEEKAAFSVMFFKEDDFKILWGKVISQLIPDGYEKTPVRGEINFEVKDKNKGAYLAKVQEEFLPQIDLQEIIFAIKGKKFSQSEAYLKKIKDSEGFDVLIGPKFFSKLKLFPLREENIKVRIEAI